MTKTEWICRCGQICLADKDPTQSFPKWNDRHICSFEKKGVSK